MKHKVSCFVPVRNKANFVGQTIDSVLKQTTDDVEVLLSDQGSTDNSLQVLKDIQTRYNGAKTVRVIECPRLEPKGLAGLNEHMDWMLTQTEAELIITVSADDLCHPQRVEKTRKAYEETNASFIGTKMQFIKPNGELDGVTAFDPKGNRFVTAREHIDQLVGGSVSTAWCRTFYEKVGGVHGPIIPDVFLPFLATLDRGFYIIDEQLFAYIRHPDHNNAGLGGQMLAADNDNDKLEINELANYQIISTLYQIGRVAVSLYPEEWAKDQDTAQCLYDNIVHRTNDWVMCRDLMNQRKLRPRLL